MQRITADDFEEIMKERHLPAPFSSLKSPTFSDYVIVGYAVGEADNKIYPCLALSRNQKTPRVISFPLKGKMLFPKLNKLCAAEEMKPGNIEKGLYNHYKGGLYYVQGTCTVALEEPKTAVLYSAIDAGLPFMWLRMLDDWNTKVLVGSEEVERFTKV